MKQSGKPIKVNNKATFLLSVLFVAMLLAGCVKEAAVPASEKVSVLVKDENPAEESSGEGSGYLAASSEINRVIALSKSNAELWILAGGELIATSEDALEIENLNEDVENLGDMDHVSLEAIAALNPDLLILFATDPAQKSLGEAAEQIGIPVVFTNIDGYSDYEKVMKEFTEITGRDDLYKENVEDVRELVESVVERVPESEEEKTYLLLHVSATKSKAEKNDYFASEIFNRLGLTNIASDDSAFDELSMEAVIAADPDYIFVVPRGNEKKAMESFEGIFASDPAWESLTAVKEGNYRLLSKDLFGLKPNNRWGEAYEEAFRILYEEE